MDYALVGIGAIVCIVAVTALSPRVGVAAPLLLVLVGVAISFVPAVPPIEIEPEVILAGVLPPLLYSTAVSMPTMDFRRDFTAISGLSVLLVAVSALLMGLFFATVIPGVDLAVGVALGAIISPTDAVATSIVRKLGVSPRVVTVLEGESLLNDASALVLLRSAIAATAASVSFLGVAADFVWAVLAAAVIGFVVGRLNLLIRSRIREAAMSTAISFVVPFVAFVPAEHVGASGLVAAVTAGLVTGRGAPRYLRPQDRLYEASNWRTIEALLEGAVFLVMGLELYGLVEDVREDHGSLWIAVALGLCAGGIVLVIRAAYVLPLLLSVRNRRRNASAFRDRLSQAQDRLDSGTFTDRHPAGNPRRDTPERVQERQAEREERFRKRLQRAFADIDYLLEVPLGWREGVVLVWAGMRGVVTLAAAQSLPADTPQRSLLVLIAFVVAGGSLLVQGGTLPWVVRVLGLAGQSGDDVDEERALLAELRTAGGEVLEADDLRRRDGRPFDEGVLADARAQFASRPDEGEADVETLPDRFDQMVDLRLQVVDAQRQALLQARSLGTYSSTALTRALNILDADQINIELRARSSSDDADD